MDDRFFVNINSLFYQVEYYEKLYNAGIVVNKAILDECLLKVNEYLDSIYPESNPSEYKIAGAVTFWFRKLKPFSFQVNDSDKYPDLFINENIAVLFGYGYIRYYRKVKGYNYFSLSSDFLADLAIQLRYSSFSPSSLALLYHAVYEAHK